MIRLAVVLALTLIAPLGQPTRAAQTLPDLSGTWRPQNVTASRPARP
jgi:hypothetical protein